MRKFSAIAIIPEALGSWASLTRNAGQPSLTVAGFSTLTNPAWKTFQTNDLDCFGTGAYNNLTPTETNTQNDGLLIIKKAGIYIVDYYVGWDAGLGTSPYEKYISVSGGYGGSSSFDVNIDRRDYSTNGVVTEGIRDSQLYGYQHVRKILSVNREFISGSKGYIQFSMINSIGSNKLVFAQFAGIVYVPSTATASPVIYS